MLWGNDARSKTTFCFSRTSPAEAALSWGGGSQTKTTAVIPNVRLRRVFYISAHFGE